MAWSAASRDSCRWAWMHALDFTIIEYTTDPRMCWRRMRTYFLQGAGRRHEDGGFRTRAASPNKERAGDWYERRAVRASSSGGQRSGFSCCMSGLQPFTSYPSGQHAHTQTQSPQLTHDHRYTGSSAHSPRPCSMRYSGSCAMCYGRHQSRPRTPLFPSSPTPPAPHPPCSHA